MIPRTRAVRAVLAGAAAAAVLLSVSACSGDDKKPDAPASAQGSDVPIPAAPAGPEVADLQARWWTWAASRPAAGNPVTDVSGQNCAQDQPDDVWFVAGTFGGTDVKRTCAVPGGRPIVGPLLNLAADKAESCAEFIAAADGEVVLDGSPVDVRKLGPEAIAITGGADNPVTHRAGEVPAQACGLWFTVAALTPGEHKLSITGVSGETRIGVEYTLKVSG